VTAVLDQIVFIYRKQHEFKSVKTARVLGNLR